MKLWVWTNLRGLDGGTVVVWADSLDDARKIALGEFPADRWASLRDELQQQEPDLDGNRRIYWQFGEG